MSNAPKKNEAAQPATAATGPDAVAVVSAAPASQASKDPHHGRGGIYTVVNGVRQRVGGTVQTSVKKD